MTPSQRHRGEDIEILNQRKALYGAAKITNPERWSKEIRNWNHQETMTLNPQKALQQEQLTTKNDAA